MGFPAGRGAMMPRGGYGGFRGGFAGGPRSAMCYKCGGPNHYARDCQAQAMKCYACGKLVREVWSAEPSRLIHQGHISRDCTAPNGGPLNTVGKTCYRCGQAGHISRECTATEANGQVDGADTLAPGTTVAAPPVA
jgi:cellular nucleic acid-binding protein